MNKDITTRRKFLSTSFRRDLNFNRQTVNEEDRTIELSFSSETPVLESPFLPPVVLLHEARAVDLTKLRDASSVLVNHDQAQVVGVPESVSLDTDGRVGRALVRFGTDPEADLWFGRVKEGIVRGVSVSFSAQRAQEIVEGTTWKSPEGRTFKGPLLVANRWTPTEISLTPIPADGTVGVGRTEPQEGESLMPPFTEEFMKLLHERGLKQDATLEEVEAFCQELVGRDDSDGGADDQLLEAAVTAARTESATEERNRVVGLRKIANLMRDDAPLDKWIREGTTVEAARAAAMEHLMATQAPVSKPGTSVTEVEVTLEAREKFNRAHEHSLLCQVSQLHMSLRKVRPQDDTAPEGASDVPPDLPLTERARAFMLRERVPGAAGLSRIQIADMLMYGGGQRAFQIGTGDLTNILENVANKSLASGFDEQAVTYTLWTTPGSLPDFKQASRAKFSEAKNFTEVLELAPIEEQAVKDAKEVYTLKTYGARMGFSRQAIINDDLSAIGRVPAAFGAASRRTIDQLVYDVLNTPPTMNEDSKALFADDHTSGDNLGSGAITVANIDTLRALMRKQTGLNGEKIDVIPRFLLVPVDLETVAFQTVQGQFVPTTTANARPMWVGNLDIVVSARLTDAAEWYLIADPASIDTVIVAGLNTTSPAPVLTRMEGTTILGTEWIAYIDVAVAAIEHRGMAQSTGV